MKRVLSVVCAALLVALCLASCGHQHEWEEATCAAPKTCKTCGETEGEPLGHKWTEATCTEPKTCSVCGETEGTSAGHQVNEADWKVIKEPLCTRGGGGRVPEVRENRIDGHADEGTYPGRLGNHLCAISFNRNRNEGKKMHRLRANHSI